MHSSRGETIEILARRYGYFPAAFRWRGRRFAVLTVEKCWTAAGRRLFQVRCIDGSFLLEQTVASSDGSGAAERAQWRVKRWPLRLWLLRAQRAATPRYPLPRRLRRPLTYRRMASVLSAAASAPAPRKDRLWILQGQRT